MKIITYFPKWLQSGVIPVLNPTVPRAESVSKSIFTNWKLSEKDNTKVKKTNHSRIENKPSLIQMYKKQKHYEKY